MAPSVQELLQCEDEYFTFCREERNIAAILYHALLLPGNLKKLLGLIGIEHPDLFKEASIYFEYAYLRDLWNKIADNNCKKTFILEVLKPSKKRGLSKMNAQEFNEYFGRRESSKDKIHYPGRWPLVWFNKNLLNEKWYDLSIMET